MPDFWVAGDLPLQFAISSLTERSAGDVMKPAINKGLTVVNKEAKRLAPVDSKNLKKAIGKFVRARKGIVTGKVTIRRGYDGAAKYAHMQEFGTQNIPAQPFLRPALANKKEAALKIVREEARKNLVKETRKLKRRAARKGR